MRIVLAVSRYPWPARQGDRLRAGQMVELLAPHHEVVVLAPAPDAGAPPPPPGWPGTLVTYRRSASLLRCARALIAAVRGEPLQAGLFYEPDLARELRRHGAAADLVILQLVRLTLHRRDVGSGPLGVDFIDSLAMNFQQRALREAPPLAWVFRWEARRLARAEARLAQIAGGALVVGRRDREFLLPHLGARGEDASSPSARRRLEVLPLAFPLSEAKSEARSEAVEPTSSGARLSEPRSSEAKSSPPREAAPYLVLTGNLGYFPTVDGALWFLREVWPRVLAGRGTAPLRLVFAGARPAAALRRQVATHARRGEAVELIDSPPQLEPWLRGAAVALAPMRSGSGQPIKILEAWQYGVPVVATAYAAAGTTGVAGEDFEVAADGPAMVRQILSLLEDAPRRRALVAAGRRRLDTEYSRPAVAGALLRWVDAVVAARDTPPSS